MNFEVKQKWLKALRSGKYKQGKFLLCEIKENDNFYCCLGVLCEIAPKNICSSEVFNNVCYISKDYDNQRHELPESVMNWAGLKCSIPYVKIRRHGSMRSVAISEINDDGDYSFDQIADIIEKQF